MNCTINSQVLGQICKSKHSCTPDKVFRDLTSADKSYLTYPYPTRGMDKNRKTTYAANTLIV